MKPKQSVPRKYNTSNQKGRSVRSGKPGILKQSFGHTNIGKLPGFQRSNFARNSFMFELDIVRYRAGKSFSSSIFSRNSNTSNQKARIATNKSTVKKETSNRTKKKTPRVLNKGDKIYNIKGTSKFTSPNGTWKEFWKKDSGKRQWPRKCSVSGCTNDARVGAHVGINQNQRQYILPMCDDCNLTRRGLMKPNSKSAAVPILKRDK